MSTYNIQKLIYSDTIIPNKYIAHYKQFFLYWNYIGSNATWKKNGSDELENTCESLVW